MEDMNLVLEPVDFNKIREKGRAHRRTQSSTAFDMSHIIKPNQNNPEVIKGIAETYLIPDANNTQRLVQATNDKQEEKQIIVEDILEIPQSSWIVPSRPSANNPMNFLKKRNLSCGGSMNGNTGSSRLIDFKSDYSTLNDIIGLNVIVERKNSVDSNEHETKSDETGNHTRNSSLTVTDSKPPLHTSSTKREPKPSNFRDKTPNTAPSNQEQSTQNTKPTGSSNQLETPTITADFQMFLQKSAKASTLGKVKLTPHKSMKKLYDNSKNKIQQSEQVDDAAGKSTKAQSTHFTFDPWKNNIAYVRDRSTSKSATPNHVRAPDLGSANQKKREFLNKSSIQGSASVKSLTTPFNMAKKISPASETNFLKTVGRTRRPGTYLLEKALTNNSEPTLQDTSTTQKSFEKTPVTDSFIDKTPVSTKKGYIDFSQVIANPSSKQVLEKKIEGLENKIDVLLERNSTLEDQTKSLISLVEKLSTQCADLIQVLQFDSS